MPSLSLCSKCSEPLPLTSLSGLCPKCASTSDTAKPAGPTPESLPVQAQSHAPTITNKPGVVESVSTISAGQLEAPAPTVTDVGGVGAADLTASARPAADTGDTPPMLPPPLPRSPAGYDLIERLGGGGMGDVFLAREHASERLVAMKFVRHPGDPVSLDRFLLELRVLAQLDHPHIVRVLSSDFLRADPYFTMEYLRGGSLSRKVKADGPFAPAEAVRMIRTIATAVSAAHAQSVIHRDLKPSNVLLCADGTPKVADFGLVKRLDETDPVTLGSGGLGTPSYMPPEQISKKNGPVGPWSDVYGLGATLYHLLVGCPPFDGESSVEVVRKVLADQPLRLRALRPEVPASLEGIVLKCLEKDPNERYQCVADLVADLDRYEAGQRPVAPPLTRWCRAKRWVRRHRQSVAMGVAVLLVVVGAFVLGAAYWPKPKPADTVADKLAEMQKRLKAGDEVELIPAKGMPAWHQWIVGAPELTTSPTGDGTCSFEPTEFGLLELCPDPMSDHYRVRAELRQLQARTPPSWQVNELGVYFGRSHLVGANGIQAQAFFLVGFADDPKVPNPPGKVAEFRSAALIQRPNKNIDLAHGGLRNVKFTQSAGMPGPWRPIEIEVSPDGVKVFWQSPAGEMLPFVALTTEQMRAEYAGIDRWLFMLPPDHGLLLPPWEPRMPLGIWCNHATIDVRNVTLTPLK